ncbi:hypothetical protein SeLEV6574_g07043 [Synchytrium endobioticum]|uniref:N-acetyltransferase domain-containing protein n=1 Tax=Synchytrium endobioticum TaxID=286115 RepID=A0A507CF33_9FUNG|nr:hypothetical protein SeLEV6574_g07043 [Synchytrium endobioticum]
MQESLLRLEDEFISAAEELQTLHVLNEKEKVKGHDVNVRRLRRKLLLRKSTTRDDDTGEIRNLYGNESEEPYNSIDYCHLQFWHLDQVNDLLWRVFWPGIDVAENLMYPDYSIVAIYRRLVVGSRFMLYYLIQSLPSRDITLHVSADNPAMMLYQQFGFKPEEFVVNFYDKYLPPDSRHCKNAFFVRLRR